MAAMCLSRGTTIFVETMFENRYRHVDELRRMGADIRVQDRVAVVTGVERLRGPRWKPTDLRGGGALCVAALGGGRGEPDHRPAPHPPGLRQPGGGFRGIGAQIREQ